MAALHQRCAGLDVHQDTVVACVRIAARGQTRRMLEALIAGESNPATLASLAHRRLRASPQALAAALQGRVTRHHRFLLALHLRQIDALAAIDVLRNGFAVELAWCIRPA